MKNTNLLWLGLLLGLSSTAPAQQALRVDTIQSRKLGARPIYVTTPEGYEIGNDRYPILVLLDANDRRLYELWVAQAAYLEGSIPGFPRMIAVGIPNGADRLHDMTPPATGSSIKDFSTAGGASAFADFIIDEVLPRIRTRYRTLPSVILVGHSAGGLFGVDVAARRPGVFNGIVATSPAIWFNDGTLPDIYADMIGRAQMRSRLWFSSGDEGDLAAACRKLAELLSANPALKDVFAYRYYADATHRLNPMSASDGLRFIFEPLSIERLPVSKLDFTKIDSVSLNAALGSSESGYRTAARSLGLPEQLPERIINRLGYTLINNKQPRLAITVFKQNVRSYPESVNVYDSLADGFLAAGDSAAALVQLREAVKVAKRTGASVEDETLQKLKALEAKK
ncbi:MAG TPA: alpha/beta hydrolase-fold protein [Longimicrobiales bacterium]|nr:alpha/beta hydrolase-fold protein [Longimicrobiales bacterium]